MRQGKKISEHRVRQVQTDILPRQPNFQVTRWWTVVQGDEGGSPVDP
jgi:hypothetical protein